jgi:hypothetical protein
MNDHNQPRETQYTLGENAVPVHITGTPYQLHNCRTHWPTALEATGRGRRGDAWDYGALALNPSPRRAASARASAAPGDAKVAGDRAAENEKHP